ncbi:LysR family transcriptional regulator [Caballeronia udeis]|uniref:LysR family transcriptional regulator n=1 Tax=Caballeronia udeis TaxID=1232866 RepID=A0A158JW80_9BURK|nr:LysR substrate-binding domain-containing protein [Caballeronia udeis]SAL72661.1 LysR family transcriptional regulator [Caballeronia udeis]
MNALVNVLTRRLKMRDLEILATIGSTLSLTRTADRMAMTQPALSKWLRELEELLLTPLFERTTRRITPTPAGQIVMLHAARILGDLQRITSDLEALHDGLSGVVRVGAPSAVAAVLIPEAVKHVLRTGAQLQIQLWDGTLDRLLPLLREREIDLVLGRLDGETLNAGCHHELLYDGPVCVTAGLQHPLQARGDIEWKDTIDYPWIVPPASSPMRHSLESAFAQVGLAMPRALMSSASLLINKTIAEDSECLFVASLHMVKELEKNQGVRHLPLYVPGVPQGIGMLWADAATPGVAAFMAALRISAARQAHAIPL